MTVSFAGICRTSDFEGGQLLPIDFTKFNSSDCLQRIAEGLSEEEAWRLFQQLVDALAHMASLNIVSVPS